MNTDMTQDYIDHIAYLKSLKKTFSEHNGEIGGVQAWYVLKVLNLTIEFLEREFGRCMYRNLTGK